MVMFATFNDDIARDNMGRKISPSQGQKATTMHHLRSHDQSKQKHPGKNRIRNNNVQYGALEITVHLRFFGSLKSTPLIT
jgi:hypothetical protein